MFSPRYGFMPYHLTTLQKEIVGYVATQPNGVSVDELADIYLQTHEGSLHQVREAVNTLDANGYLGQDWHSDRGFVVGCTEHGLLEASDLKRWFGGVAHCNACVRLPCVCSISIGCLTGGPERQHSVGCHGTHD